MSWQTITDALIVLEFLRTPVVCCRIVLLSLPGVDLTATASSTSALLDAAWEGRYELRSYKSLPASVLAFDAKNERMVGAYVWKGKGGAISSAGDTRMVQLADRLEADLKGKTLHQFSESPLQTCADCVGEFNSADGTSTNVIDYDAGTHRETDEGLPMKKMLEILGGNCTDAQLRATDRLIEHGHELFGAVNLREAGGPAIDVVCPWLVDRFDNDWIVQPSGEILRFGE